MAKSIFKYLRESQTEVVDKPEVKKVTEASAMRLKDPKRIGVPKVSGTEGVASFAGKKRKPSVSKIGTKRTTLENEEGISVAEVGSDVETPTPISILSDLLAENDYVLQGYDEETNKFTLSRGEINVTFEDVTAEELEEIIAKDVNF